jgi:hypothetical protein
MEIRHTIEILVKDIQDIEKLVANLQNSPAWPAIEMDLAMSKLRNVYEVLSMIRDDRYRISGTPEQGLASPAGGQASMATKATDTNPTEVNRPTTPAPDQNPPSAKPSTGTGSPDVGIQTPAHDPPLAKPSTEPESSTTGKHLQTPAPETIPPAVSSQPVPPSDEPSMPTADTDRMPPDVSRPIPPAQDQPQSAANHGNGSIDSGKIAAILAEKFSREASINENMASQRSNVMESRLAGKPIDNIARNIGINDRFMIIRELFGGNSEDYSRLIRSLDEAGSLERAMEIIREQFPASMKHDGVIILISLATRRFVRA